MQCVVDLWERTILSPDGALQFLLLVDYIFDWARDSYREDIIKGLRVLSSEWSDHATYPNVDTDYPSGGHFDDLEHSSPEGEREQLQTHPATKENQAYGSGP